jgi:hypothetical protein
MFKGSQLSQKHPPAPGRHAMSSRERFFECVLSQDTDEYRFHVRTWNAKDAEEEARASLRSSGVQDQGTLQIRDPKGVEIVHASYAG